MIFHSNPPVIEVSHLVKFFGDVEVLKDIDFKTYPGDVICVIGSSGSGKSTLLRCINMLEVPTGGQILFNGVNIMDRHTKITEYRAKVGMVFQQFNLVKRSSVYINVMSGRLGYLDTFPSLLHAFSGSDRAKAMANLEQVGLSEKVNVRVDSLSGGQQQRVGIARALMQDPKLMLADEPVASLDPVLAHSILKYLEVLNKERGITVLCSLHFLDLVHRYATRAIALKDGELVFKGLPKEIDDAQFKTIYGQEAERITII